MTFFFCRMYLVSQNVMTSVMTFTKLVLPKKMPTTKHLQRLNPNKCTFGVRSGKLLGFVVSDKGIQVDPAKVKAIQEMPSPRTEKEVRGLLGRLNYIARFISHLTATCELIFKLLKKDQVVKWNDECQTAFERSLKIEIGRAHV